MVTVVPTAAMPTPVATARAPMAVVAMPMHLLWLELGGFLAGGDGGVSVGIAFRHAGGAADRLR